MNRLKIYYETSTYLTMSVLVYFVILIAGISAIGSDNPKSIIAIRGVILFTPIMLFDWIRKRKYFMDIFKKRILENRGKVINCWCDDPMTSSTMNLRVKIEKSNDVVEFIGTGKTFFNDKNCNWKNDLKYDYWDNIDSMTFTYLEKSKVIIHVLDYDVKSSDSQKTKKNRKRNERERKYGCRK